VKTVRVLLVVAGVVIALALAVAFVPAVQRWAVLKAAGNRAGSKLEVTRLAIRPGSIAVHDLRLEQPGLRVALADASAEFSLWDAIAHRRVVLRDVRVAGLKVDLTGPAGPPRTLAVGSGGQAGPVGSSTGVPPPASKPVSAAGPAQLAPARPAFEGAFKYFRLPVVVVIESCNVEMEVLFPQAAGKPPGEARLKLTGGHFAPGQEAKFDFEATVRNPDPGSPFDKVAVRGALTATLDTLSVPERISLHLEAEAFGPLLATNARGQADVLLARTSAGETYSLTLNFLEAGAVSRLLNLNVDYVAGSAKLAGSWQVLASNRQVAPFALGMALPEFSVAGEGRFEVNSTTLDVRLAGRLTGDANRLEVVDSRLRELGRLGATAAFDVESNGDQVHATELKVNITGRRPVLTLQTVQAFTVKLATGETVAEDAQRELVRIALDGLPVAWVRPLLPGFEVAGDEIRGEFVASMRTADKVWLRTTSPLTVRGLAVSRAGRLLLSPSDVSLQADVENSQSETRIRLGGLTLTTAAGDRLEVKGELAMKAGAEARAISAQAEFDANLPALLAAFAPIGPVTAHGSVALSESGDMIQVDRLDARVATPEGRLLLDLSSPQAFRVNPVRRQITAVAGRSGEVLRVKYGRMPLSQLDAFCSGLELGGELAEGELVVRTDGEKLQFAMAAPMRLDKLTAGADGQTWLKDLTVEIEPAVEYSERGATARLAALRVRTGAGDSLLSGQAEATIGPDLSQPKFQGTASFDLLVSALAGQPILAGAGVPRQGKLTGEAKFSSDHDLLSEGRLTLNGFASAATGEPLPVANLSFRAGLNEKGEIALQMPLLVDRAGERSDLTLAATMRPAAKGRTIDVRITGEHFVVDDALMLVRAFSAQPAGDRAIGAPEKESQPAKPADSPPRQAPVAAGPAPAPLAAATAVPSQPEWAGLTGQVALNVKSLVYGRNFEVTGLTGQATINPLRIAAENVTAKLGTDGQLKLDAEAKFLAGAPLPYTSKLNLNLKEFEVGPVFKTLDPTKPPTIEGRFNVRYQAEGAGRTLVDSIERTQGAFVMQSRKGIFRGLQQEDTTFSFVARLLGSFGEKVEAKASGLELAAELANQLAEFHFDQMNVRMWRDQSLNTRLADFSLVSPILRLQGQGEGLITYEAGKSVLKQPLQLPVYMGVMGPVETMISKSKLRVLSDERDELGYLKLREPFTVGGTLARPNAGQLYSQIRRSLIDSLLH
jgi:hypothetical protein